MIQRVPPHDIAAEAAVLSAALLDRGALDRVVELLKPEHFYSEANRRILEGAIELSANGIPVDIVSVAGWLRDRERLAQVGGAEYLASIADAVPFIANIEVYANIVREKWRMRQLISVCQKYAAGGFGDVGEPQAYIDQCEQEIFEISQSKTSARMKRINRVTPVVWKQIEDAAVRKGMIGVPTGFEVLDALTGGLHKKQFTLVAARPSMGKTSLAMNIAVTVAGMGFGVAVFSPEMTSEEIVLRAASSEARTSLAKAIRGRLKDYEYNALLEGTNLVHDLPIWIDDTPGIGLFEIKAGVRRVKVDCAAEGRPLVLVVIDGIGLLKPIPKHNQTREQEVSSIAEGLKEASKELDVVLMGVVQLSRKPEERPNKRPQLSDLRESGALEQSADNVIFVYRDEYYHEETADKGVAELNIAKQRQGPRGPGVVAKVAFNGSYTRFDNLAKDHGSYEPPTQD